MFDVSVRGTIMSAARTRKHRRIQPYAWLGAGAVTVGMGAALLGGTAVAFAGTGEDAGDTATTSSQTSSAPDTSVATPAPAKTDAGPQRKSRVSRSAGASAPSGNTASSPTSAPSVPERASVATPDVTPEPAAAVTPDPVELEQIATPAVSEPQKAPARAVRRAVAPLALPEAAANWLAPKPAAATTPMAAAAVPPSPDPDLAPNAGVSWLPGGNCSETGVCFGPQGQNPVGQNPLPQIVPGSYVALAKDQISATQGLIFQEGFGSGNVFAGLAGLVPQLFLATSTLSLGLWSATNDFSKGLVAGTAGIPLIHQVAQLNLMANMLLPAISDASLGAAGFFLPVMGFLGADIDASTALLGQAQDNAKVYSIVPVRVYAGTQPLVNARVNGGSNLSLLVDTGASGLLTTKDKVNTTGLTQVGTGSINFSGNQGAPYDYVIYEAPVDFGGGAVTGAGATINVIEDNDQIANFQNFIFYADGILGVGANSDGPGIAPIPTATLPGELKSGMLLFQNFLPFGLGGLMVFGLNPLPVNEDKILPGMPDAWIKIGVNGADPVVRQTQTPAIVDSGGVYGTIRPEDISPSLVETYVPSEGSPYLAVKPGVRITGYTPDGVELYSYTTIAGQTPVTQDNNPGTYMNSGNAPFAQNPVYLNNGYANGTADYGIGSTEFSIW